MATTTESAVASQWVTLADMMTDLGDIPLHRIGVVPPPGTATEKDLLEAESRCGRLCELIDGVLVEKTMGYVESFIAARIIYLLQAFLEKHNLGAVSGADGTLRILPGQVRMPDVSFICWERFPGGKVPREPIPPIVPDLAIEVLSKGNTPGEMERKLREYFAAGVRLVWYIDPQSRSAKAYTSPDDFAVFGEADCVPGGDVLPGFCLSLSTGVPRYSAVSR